MKARDAIAFLALAALTGCGFMPTDAGSVPSLDGAADERGEEGITDLAPAGDPEWGDEMDLEACIPCDPEIGCDDGKLCTGEEECLWSDADEDFCCRADAPLCPDEGSCLVGDCSEEMGGCILLPLDDDGDGHTPVSCGGGDCDDADYAVHPGAREKCDALDNDCDGAIDEDSWVDDGEALLLSDGTLMSHHAALAAGSLSWGVIWLTDTSTSTQVNVGALVPGVSGPTASVTTIDSDFGTPREVAIVPDGTGFVVLWTASGTGEGESVAGVRLEPDGSIPGAQIEVLRLPSSILDLSAATTSVSGRLGLFFRSDLHADYEIYFLDTGWPPPWTSYADDVSRMTWSPGFSGRPSAAGLDSTFAFAWEDDRDGNLEIYFATMDTADRMDWTVRVTTAPGDSHDVSLAVTPAASSYGLAWMDSRAGGHDMLFTCLDAAGARACAELAITTGPERAWYPSVIHDGIADQFAIAYAGLESGLFTARLTAVAPSADPAPDDVDPGRPLGNDAELILDPAAGDATGHRGVLWIESDGGSTGAVHFQQLKCEEE